MNGCEHGFGDVIIDEDGVTIYRCNDDCGKLIVSLTDGEGLEFTITFPELCSLADIIMHIMFFKEQP